jgi:hypothetical protein
LTVSGGRVAGAVSTISDETFGLVTGTFSNDRAELVQDCLLYLTRGDGDSICPRNVEAVAIIPFGYAQQYRLEACKTTESNGMMMRPDDDYIVISVLKLTSVMLAFMFAGRVAALILR